MLFDITKTVLTQNVEQYPKKLDHFLKYNHAMFYDLNQTVYTVFPNNIEQMIFFYVNFDKCRRQIINYEEKRATPNMDKRHPRDSKRNPRTFQEASETSRGSKTPPRGLGGPILTPFGKPRGLPKQ